MDWYVKYPLLKDLSLIIFIWFASSKLSFVKFNLVDKANQLNIISNIISACLSLGGFLIAALTILVTYKLSIKSDSFENSKSPIEFVFVSKHYPAMIKIYQGAIVELFMLCLVLYIGWASSDNLTIATINKLVVSSLIAAALAIFRSTMLLFKLLNLDQSINQRQYVQNDDF